VKEYKVTKLWGSLPFAWLDGAFEDTASLQLGIFSVLLLEEKG
jgi:hypothetical protein